MNIRIVTWNIAGARKLLSNKKFDYGLEDVSYFAAELKKLDPDIVCLQESHVNKQDSLAWRLASRLGTRYVAETPGCPSHIDERYQLTTAVISKLSFTKSISLPLPQPDFELKFAHNGKVAPPYNRYVQLLDFNGFTVATMHPEPLGAFGLAYEQGTGRELGKRIDTFLQTSLKTPLLFLGDFNMKEPLSVLTQSARTFGLQAARINRSTTPHGGHPDHILYSPEWRVLGSGVVTTKSDHYICWADVAL